MPSIYQLKPAFQNLLRPLVKILYQWGVSANMVTVLGMLISIFLAGYLYLHFLHHSASLLILLFPIWMLIRMGFNAIDGMLAREFNQQSDLGAFLNELCDVISDTALYLCFIAFHFIHPGLLLCVTFLAILSEYTGVMAPLVGIQRRYDGPMGKSDRAFFFSLLAFFIVALSYFPAHQHMFSIISNAFIGIIGLLLLYTIYNRIKNTLQQANAQS